MYIWCAVGAALGWVAGLMAGSQGTAIIENVLVGVFGAFIGAEFIVSMLDGPVAADKSFQLRTLLFAVAGSVVTLVLLRLMRRAVGPQSASKSRKRDRN